MKRLLAHRQVLAAAGVIAASLAWTLWAQADEGGDEAAQADYGTAASAETPAAEPAVPAEPDTALAGGADAAVASSAPGLISVDFKDADIRQVLRIISLKSGVDIVAGADVEGLVTIKLTNVPWEQALDIILRTYGFTYERKDQIVRVMTIEALEQEALSTEVFPLDYAKAEEVPGVIKEMLSERGRVKFDERTNTVIVTDIPTNLFQIKQVITRLDQRTPQVLIESRVVETRLQKTEDLGIDWTNTLSTTWTQTIPDLQSSFPFKPNTSFGEVGEAFGVQRAPERSATAFSLGTLTTPSLSAVLNILQSRADTNILSNPTIAVLNNKEAKIHIGQEYPIPNYTIDPTTGRTTISGYTAKKVGTVLTVTPYVNPSLEIVVKLKPEIVVAEATGVTYNTGADTSVTLPLFTTQTAETQVRIHNNETIAIGGLVKTSEQSTEVKVPLLGDIPIIGLLFKNTERDSGGSDPNRQDLLIFLTVKIMDQEAPGAQTAAVAP